MLMNVIYYLSPILELESMSSPPRQMSKSIPLDQSSSVSSSPMYSPPMFSPPASSNLPTTKNCPFENYKVNWDKKPPQLYYTRSLHLVRNNTLGRHRASKKNATKPSGGPADTYGCTQWQPEHPTDETEESLEDKRLMLMEIFSREGSSGMERAEVLTLMETTYSLQRQMINEYPGATLDDVKQEWPYLFFPRSICTHFERLTDVPILQKIEAFVEEHGSSIMEFFKQSPTNDAVKAVLSNIDCSVTAANILQVLMAHFKEPLDALVIQTDVRLYVLKDCFAFL